jgi:hypothetical protein
VRARNRTRRERRKKRHSSGGLGFRGEKEMCPREIEKGKKGSRAPGWRRPAGPASGRRRGDAAAAGQPAMPGRVTRGREGLTGGPG